MGGQLVSLGHSIDMKINNLDDRTTLHRNCQGLAIPIADRYIT